MSILSTRDTPFFIVCSTMGFWLINFIASLVGLFISLYMFITHDDLDCGYLEPVDMSNTLATVRILTKF